MNKSANMLALIQIFPSGFGKYSDGQRGEAPRGVSVQFSGTLRIDVKLLTFGPEKRVAGHPNDPHSQSDLPLFGWANRKD